MSTHHLSVPTTWVDFKPRTQMFNQDKSVSRNTKLSINSPISAVFVRKSFCKICPGFKLLTFAVIFMVARLLIENHLPDGQLADMTVRKDYLLISDQDFFTDDQVRVINLIFPSNLNIKCEFEFSKNFGKDQIPIRHSSNKSNPNTNKPIDAQIILNLNEYQLISEKLRSNYL